MTRIINISGKEGTGKTTVAINLAIAMHKKGRSVSIVDMNFPNPHMSLYLNSNVYNTMNDFLKNKIDFESVIYRHPSGIRAVFSSLSTENIFEQVDVDIERLKEEIKRTFRHVDFVIIDSPGGFGKDYRLSIYPSDEIIFVSTPSVSGIAEINRYEEFLNNLKSRPKISGIIINMVRNKKYEISRKDITKFSELPVIGIIPEDDCVREGSNNRRPFILHNPKSKAGKAIDEITKKIGFSIRKI